MTGIWLFFAMIGSASASSRLGTATRTMSQPDAVSSEPNACYPESPADVTVDEPAAAVHCRRVFVLRDGRVKPTDTVVVFNTGGALKYLDVLT